MPTVVQNTAGRSTNCINCNQAFISNVTAGNDIIVGITVSGGAATEDKGCGSTPASAVTSVTDTLGNTFSQAVASSCFVRASDNESFISYIYYATNSGGGADTITVHLNQQSNIIGIHPYEVSGLGTNLTITTGTGGSATAGTSFSTSSTSFTGSTYFLLGMVAFASGVITAGANFSVASGTTPSSATEYSTTASSPTTFPMTSDTSSVWSESGAAFVGVITNPFFESGSKRFYRRFSRTRSHDSVGSMLSLQGFHPSWLLWLMQALVLFKMPKALSPSR